MIRLKAVAEMILMYSAVAAAMMSFQTIWAITHSFEGLSTKDISLTTRPSVSNPVLEIGFYDS